MLKKIIIALLTGFISVFSLVIIIGFCIESTYNFVLMNAFWVGTEPKYIVFTLIILSLTVSLVALIALIDKD